MDRIIKSLTWATAFTCAAAHGLLAQNYSLSPGDSIVATAQFDDLTVHNILQNNISSDTLFLSWKKVSALVPSGWEALNCDNNNCYTELKDSGIMKPITLGEYGFISVHITPHYVAGTALVRYAVWETNNPSARDTLTWIISADITGIEDQLPIEESIFLAGNRLLIHTGTVAHKIVDIVNTEGEIFFRKNFQVPSTVIDLSSFPSGIYLVNLRGENFKQTQKIFW
ncbi:MAG: T9SS type A sorting domain-containing protein [Chitinophagales bacterium]|nr:T9SS type A sorting domain-containing protein [Chitinophagales bacterium]